MQNPIPCIYKQIYKVSTLKYPTDRSFDEKSLIDIKIKVESKAKLPKIPSKTTVIEKCSKTSKLFFRFTICDIGKDG